MTSWFTLVCVLLGTSHLLVAGAQTKYGVTVQVVKPEELAQAKTYVWGVNRAAFDKDADTLIIAAVDRELAARGFTKLPSGQSDVSVAYGALGRTDVDTTKSQEGASERDFSVGSIVVELRDPKRQSLFRVRMDTPIKRDPATIGAAINAAVTAIFEKYPKR
jgi:hypothetical protein